jgi:hypothetical protein
MVTTAELGSLETHDTGTTTGLDHESGTMSEFGTKTNELVGTSTTTDDGTGTINESGTESGTADHETTTRDGDEATTMTSEAGKLETAEAGTTTGDDHDDGTANDSIDPTNDNAAGVWKAWVGGLLHLSTAEAETIANPDGIVTDDGMNDGELYGTTNEAAGTMMVPWVEMTCPFDNS